MDAAVAGGARGWCGTPAAGDDAAHGLTTSYSPLATHHSLLTTALLTMAGGDAAPGRGGDAAARHARLGARPHRARPYNRRDHRDPTLTPRNPPTPTLTPTPTPTPTLTPTLTRLLQDEETTRLQRAHDEAAQRDRARKTQMQATPHLLPSTPLASTYCLARIV